MNKRKSSLSQQTLAVLVANFLGISYVTVKPVRLPPPKKKKNSRGALNRRSELRPEPDF